MILDAARTAFADTGYHETSLDAVAERAGVSKALLYEHFSSKRELYVAMLEMHVHELVERISGAVAGAEPGEAEDARRPRGLLRLRRGAPRRLADHVPQRRRPDVAVRLDRLRDEVAAAIVQLMSEEAERKGLDFPKLPQFVEMIAQQMVGAMQSLADWWDLHRKVPEGGGGPGGDGLRLGRPGADQPGAALGSELAARACRRRPRRRTGGRALSSRA